MSKTTATSLRALVETDKLEGLTKSTTFRIDPKLVHLEKGFNLRTEGDELELHIDRLFLAMKAGGFIPPIDVQIVNGKITARDGHCRQRAALRLKKEIPEYTLECRQLRGNEQDAVLHMLGTGSGSKPLTPLEQGRGYLRLIKMGMTPIAIAEKLGISRVTVDNGVALAEAPVEVQKAIESGAVSSTTAREAIKGGEAGVTALLDAVKENKEAPAPAASADTPPKEGSEKTKPEKPAKKKKVTSKTLRGTAAAKKKKGATTPETAPVTPLPAAIINGDNITFTANKADAVETLKFLKDYMGDDTKLIAFAAVLEMALM